MTKLVFFFSVTPTSTLQADAALVFCTEHGKHVLLITQTFLLSESAILLDLSPALTPNPMITSFWHQGLFCQWLAGQTNKQC